jgi:hypothetical protein
VDDREIMEKYFNSVSKNMSRDRPLSSWDKIFVDQFNIYFERMEDFKYVGTTLSNQNSIQNKIKTRLKSGNACYHSVQNISSSSLLSKNLKIKAYRRIILTVVLYGCETWSLRREECRLNVFENRVLGENIWA